MDRAQIFSTFRELASEIAERDFSDVREESTIAELAMDSLGLLELIGSIERELGAEIPEEALVDVTTVAQLLDVVEGSLQKQS